MTSSVKQLFHIIAKNWIGVILGILYSIFGFFMFFAGLSYGASCPDAGPEFCDNLKRRVDIAIVDAIGSSGFYFFVPHMFSWSIVFFVGQQFIVLANPQILASGSVAGDFTGLLAVVGVITSALWAIIGAYSQQWIRNIRRD